MGGFVWSSWDFFKYYQRVEIDATQRQRQRNVRDVRVQVTGYLPLTMPSAPHCT